MGARAAPSSGAKLSGGVTQACRTRVAQYQRLSTSSISTRPFQTTVALCLP